MTSASLMRPEKDRPPPRAAHYEWAGTPPDISRCGCSTWCGPHAHPLTSVLAMPEPAICLELYLKETLATSQSALSCAGPSPRASLNTSPRPPTRAIRFATEAAMPPSPSYVISPATSMCVCGLTHRQTYNCRPPCQRPARARSKKATSSLAQTCPSSVFGSSPRKPGLDPIRGPLCIALTRTPYESGGWRPHVRPKQPTGPKAFGRLNPAESFSSTDVRLAVPGLLETYDDRWAIEIAIRDGHAYYGLAQDQCRKYTHIVGANTLRLLLAAARTLWFIGTSEQQPDVSLQRGRPWYRQKMAPSQFDVAWACREGLQEAGIFPIPRLFTAVAENRQELDTSEPIAA